MKRSVLLALVVSMVISIWYALGAPQARAGQVTVSFFSHRFTEVPYGDILRKQVAEYMKLNPNIKIEVVEAPTAERLTKLSAMILGGSPPDAVFAARDYASLVAQGLLMDVESFVDKEGGKKYKDLFPPHASAAVTDPFTGKWVAIPAETQLWTLTVNPDLTRAAGVELPKDGIWSWEQFMAAANKLNKPAENKYAYVNYGYKGGGGQTIVVGQWMLANGGSYWGYSDDCKSVNLMTKENIEAVEHYVSLGMKGYQPPGYIERGGGDHYRVFAETTAAMGVTHPGGVANTITMSKGKIKELVPVYLPGKNPRVSLYVEAWGIAKGAKRPNEAWEFIKWLNTDEKALERQKVQGTLPASTSAMNYVKGQVPKMAFWVDMTKRSDYACYEYLPRSTEVKKEVDDALTQMYQGKPVRETMQAIETKIRALLK